MQVAVVVSATPEGGISHLGGMPWPRSDANIKHFNKVIRTTRMPVTRNAILMGRNTWESLPRPFSGVINIVVSCTLHSNALDPNAVVAHSLAGAIQAAADAGAEAAFVVGGAALLTEALSSPQVSQLYITRFRLPWICDVVVPGLSQKALDTSTVWCSVADVVDADIPECSFQFFDRRVEAKLPEQQYLDLVAQVLVRPLRDERTKVGTHSQFGGRLSFSLKDDVFPLLTTKRVHWASVAKELLWMISGSTNAKDLEAAGVSIWSANGSRAALDCRGLHEYEEGDLGPVYGFQWRHSGAKYVGCKADYSGQGVDQLQEVIHTLRTDPSDRRMIICAWNPSDLSKMALPPCHAFVQFWVGVGDHGPGLYCQMYQRSADLGLGVPFNIASYALLTRLVSAATGIPAAGVTLLFGDAHVYRNHVEPLKEQLTRPPRPFPKLRLGRVMEVLPDIDGWKYEDFVLEGYDPHAAIKMAMAV